MAKLIRIEHPADFEWLKQLFTRAHISSRTNASKYTPELTEIIGRIAEAFEAAESAEGDLAPSEPVPVKKRKPRRPKDDVLVLSQYACREHPTYGAQRMPRKDCEGCWAFYKRLQPTLYVTAKMRYERNQRKQSSSGG